MFAASTQPLLTCQVLVGRFAQSHGLGGADAVGLDGGVVAVEHVDELRVVAARDAVDPGDRIFVQVMEYFHPVFRS